ncbi:MAG: DUF362 domain-containing protein, partial [candidate division Zixibacteria bacterium]|nr:DUF362 domain-containing protein [candidate division Zixibacteria bacterium]
MDAKRRLCQIKNHWHWLVGPMALIWLLVRSGANPKRLTYPCQRAAMPVAASWVLAAAAFFAGSLLLRRFAKVSAVAMVLAGVIWMIAGSPDVSQSRTVRWQMESIAPPPVWQVPDPTSKVVVLDGLRPAMVTLAAGDASVPDENLSDDVMDELLGAMTAEGIHLYRNQSQPEGVVGADNVVLIKGNFQWTAQNVTSADRVKGLIWQILNHPDGFTGEIIVADNTQDHGTGINDFDNNSDDQEQSIVDVVNSFYDKGYPVYLVDWFSMFYEVVWEYELGDMSDGFTYDSYTRVTYPKFRSPSEQYYISAGKGIWDPQTSSYDSSKLCIINFPVLKAHWMAGATIAVKNWIGMGTIAYYNERYGGIDPLHYTYLFTPYALTARIMEATYPRLSIVDASWTTCDGPHILDTLARTNMILASTDPVAVSWYAAKYILTPVADRPNETDPDLATGLYGECLDNWTAYLVDSAGMPCTKDSAEITVSDGGVNFQVDTAFGSVPLEVGFEATSLLSVNSWEWDFGDGGSSTTPSATHTYENPGLYDVTVSVDSDGDTRTRTKHRYIAALADTLAASTFDLPIGGNIELVINGANVLPLNSITIPVEFSGTLDLQYDSMSVAGCRTEFFEDVQILHYSPVGKKLTLQLQTSSNYPGLQAGTGSVVKLHFHTVGASSGDSVAILLDGYTVGASDHLPLFAGVWPDYAPATVAGVVRISDCCKDIRGNVDGDPLDVVDIGDLVYLVDFMFSGGADPDCWKEANIDGDLMGDYTHDI